MKLKPRELCILLFAVFFIFIALFFHSPTDLGLNRLYFDNINLLLGLNYVFFTSSLLLSVAILICSWRKIRKYLSKISSGSFKVLLSIIILALLLRVYLPMEMIRWTVLNAFLADSPDIPGGTAYLRGIGWTYLVNYATLVFDPTYSTTIGITIAIGTLTVLLSFLFSYLLFENENSALFAAFLFAISPAMIIISKGGEYTGPAIFFTLLAFSAILLYSRVGDSIFLVLSSLLLVVTIQIRPDYFFIIFVYFFAVAIFLKYGERHRMFSIFLCFFVLSSPYTLPFLVNSKSNTNDFFLYGTAITERNSLMPYLSNAYRLVRENFTSNIITFFNNSKATIAEILLSILGIYALLRTKKIKEVSFLVAYFATFFLLVSLVHKEGFFDSWFKYLPSALAPALLVAGVGLKEVYALTKKQHWFFALFLLAVASNSYLTYSKNHSIVLDTDYEVAKYLEYENLQKYSGKINRSCYMVYSGQDSLVGAALAIDTLELQNEREMWQFMRTPKSGCFYIYSGYYDPTKDRVENWVRIEQDYMFNYFNRTYPLQRIFDETLPERYYPARGRNFLYAVTPS